MLRSEIPGNKKHLTDEISSKIVEYNLSRGSEPLIRKRNNLDPKLENKYNNKKVVSILEGGYDLNALAESADEHVRALQQNK